MKRRLACSIFFMAVALATGTCLALNPNNGLRIEVMAAPNFVVDSNVGTPASKSPRAAYVGARFWNDGTTVLSNVVVSIGNYNDGIGSTPGVYPARANPIPLVGKGTYFFTHEGGSSGLTDAVRVVGTIQPGEHAVVYWLLSYPLMSYDGTTPVFGAGSNFLDDLCLEYDIWGTAKREGSTITADQTSKATMRSEISAMANKIFPNTSNQVPDEYKELLNLYQPAWTNVAADGSVGTWITAEGVWYQLGNVSKGYDADNDLIPDADAWLQPVGDPSIFDSGAFRLVRTRTLLVIKLKTGGEQVITANDQLYFKDLPENTIVVGYVLYEFVPIKPASSSQLSPYQQAASGSNNEKFNGDFGAMLGTPFVSLSPSATMTLSTSVSNAAPGATIPYTITFTNSGTLAMGNPDAGVPVVVQETIPPGTRYVQNSATTNNLPPGSGSFTILYSTNNAVSWVSGEPAAFTNVTHIQWWMNEPLLPGGAGIVRFSVTVNNPYTATPLAVNTAGLSIGNNPPFLTASASTLISGNNFLGDLVWFDTGAGDGIFGNKVKETGESGASNITVNLYYDSNTNGTLEAGDFFVGTTSSGSVGGYLFTNLVDGSYLAIINMSDPDIPAGYTLSTPEQVVVNVDLARTNGSPVGVLTADFGLVAAMSMSKRLTSPGPAYEGRAISYAITVTNNMDGNGSGGIPVEYTVWATNLFSADTGWLISSNAVGAPNGTYSTSFLEKNQNDYLALTGFDLTGKTGNINRVKVAVPIQVVASWPAQTFCVTLLTSAGVEFFRTNFVGHTSVATGTLVFDVTTNRVWQWSDFNSSAVRIQMQTIKSGGAPGGSVGVDAAGFLVTGFEPAGGGASSITTLNPVPVVDTFDTQLLQLTSAIPMYSSLVTNGTTGVITWNNVGPLYPGGGRTLALNFVGREPPSNTATIVTNTASITNAFFVGGRSANTVVSQAITNFLPTGVIGDYVWRDQDRNGATNGTEYGLANVSVVLRPPVGVDAGAGVNVPITNVTDSTGYYLFSGLISTGRYVVVVLTNTLPRAGVNVTNTWTEMNGTSNPTNVTVVTNMVPWSTNGADNQRGADFGYSWSGSTVGGWVWNDLNRSGTSTADSGEFGLTNVTVFLYLTNNPSVAIATNRTGSTGYFSFNGIASGDYFVQVTTNTGPLSGGTTWLQTYAAGVLPITNRVQVTVASNGAVNASMSFFQTGIYAIGDTLFYDWNGDGITNGVDEGIFNIPVSLYRDSNSNGVVDVGIDVLFATTNTTATGAYVFTNYPAGNYLVFVNQSVTNFPPLYAITRDPFGARDGLSFLVVTNASNWNQDFGYQPLGGSSIGDVVWKDMNADGTQGGLQETGIANVTVSLYVDLNGDGSFVLLTTTNTLSNGQYSFPNLPAGNYRVVVDTASTNLPRDSLNIPYLPSTTNSVSVTVPSTNSNFRVGFGFAPLGGVGGTIFMDSNANGTQDWNEGGITNVSVTLYRDTNTNGVYDAGFDVSYATTTTITNGIYLFSALPTDRYVVVVNTNSTTALLGMRLTAAPALDGQPLTNAADQSLYSQYRVNIQPGVAFMGADFGFQPPGVIGQTVWIDTDGDGVRDDSERGLVNVALILSNSVMTVTNRTDVDGYYNFSNLGNGTYWLYAVTNDLQFVGLQASVDADGTNTANVITSIVITNGHVYSIAGIVNTNGDLCLNFSYRYSGNNALSGTVGLDGSLKNGVLGTGTSGVSVDETAFPGETVLIYIWRDADTNGVMDAGETTQIKSTVTDSNGDYQFTGLPTSLGAGTNRYVVALSAPREHLLLTTTNGSTPALLVVPTTNTVGEVLSVYQRVAISTTVTNIDFAFQEAWTYDFGDLPSSYGTLLSDQPDGARHRVLTTPTLYLGSGVSTDTNGQPIATAALDTLDDGVVRAGIWQNGLSNGTVQVRVEKGTGYLVGYVDFNRNGNFQDEGELIVSSSVTTNGGNGSGVYTWPVPVPTNSILPSSMTTLYARFRLFPTQPAFPEVAHSGSSENGEVEDYRWDLGAISGLLWNDSDGNGLYELGEPFLENIRLFVDVNSNGVWEATEPFSLTGTNGVYGIGGLSAGSFTISVDTNTLPVGLYQTTPLGLTNHQVVVTLTEGETNTSASFGYAYRGAISGSVLIDLNGNGVADVADTNGYSGVTIELLTNGVVFATTTTSSTGGYAFTNLMLGSYTLRKVNPANAYGNLDSSAPNDNLIPVTLLSGESDTGNNFYATQVATIGDFVWNDQDADGIQDGGEPGLTNVTVRLLDSGSNLLFSAVTDVSGAYSFTNLQAATYLLQVVAPTQYVFTIQDTASTNDLADSDVNASGKTAPFVLTSGMNDTSLDAGLYRAARIFGYAFYDINTNLVRNARVDYPIANMTVTLWRASTQVASTLTSADGTGKFEFRNLEAGSYTLRFVGATNLLEAVPSSAPASTDPERNRAALDGNGLIAVSLSVNPGEGEVFAAEPRNVGFIRAERPLSESVAIRAYMTADGVLVEFTTSGEEDYGWITLWVWLDGGWVELGSTLAVGFGSNTYSFDAPGLVAGERYYFQAMDEVGYLYDLYGVEVTPFAMELQVMERTGVRLSWATVPNRWYAVYTTLALGTPWELLDMVWAEAESTSLDVRIDPAEPQRFFKIEMLRDSVIEEGGAQ